MRIQVNLTEVSLAPEMLNLATYRLACGRDRVRNAISRLVVLVSSLCMHTAWFRPEPTYVAECGNVSHLQM